MPTGVARIRIAGFKSFAEPAVLEVQAGLTGIVGPNGCGKSNVVEALRWAMGESSARSLRGGEMDDVIFAGTTNRPARNLAEVTLTVLPGPGGALPPPFQAQSELEVGRRIERGSGSTYRVNGKEARARDVQTLFADLASGARSSAMVSQGRVGALVSARPDERRAILEEAAGVAGLHSRRHEAELKLRAAEANLERAEVGRTELSAQLAGLQKQSRQAARYRALSGLLRTAEAELLSVQHAHAAADRARAVSIRAECQAAIAGAADLAGARAAEAEAASSRLPPLREVEAVARTGLERHRIACERIEAEQISARAALDAAGEAVLQIARDAAHAGALCGDADTAEQRLRTEAAQLADQMQASPDQAEAAGAALAEAEAALRAADACMHASTEAAAALAAHGYAAAEVLQRAQARSARIEVEWQSLARERATLHPVDVDAVQHAAISAETAEADEATSEQAQHRAEAHRATVQEAQAQARATLHDIEPVRARLAAEAQALAEILGVHAQGAAFRLVDILAVPQGLEAAIGAALGEGLELATDPAAPRYWQLLQPLDPCPALPAGVTPLGTLITAPAALTRVLSQIGLVEPDAAEALQPHLLAGQALVSRDGAVRRWDGFVQRAGAPTDAAVRLLQRRRLAELEPRLHAADTEHAAAGAAFAAAKLTEANAAAAETQARAARRMAEQHAVRAREALSALQRRSDAARSRIEAVEAQIVRLADQRDAAVAELRLAAASHAALPDLTVARQDVNQARGVLSAARAAEHAARAQIDAVQRDAAARQARLRAILTERAGWSDRARDAAIRLTELTARQATAQARQAERAGAPERLAQAGARAVTDLARAEQTHQAAVMHLRAADAAALDADRADRASGAALAGCREAVLRAEAECSAADRAWGTIAERVLERLGADAVLPSPAELGADAEERARRRLERLVREREEMGPVNLRAELEAQELEARAAGIEHERAELAEAIHKLRGSIGHLNREGRARLSAVFAEVDRHFQALFTRMFGGGRAQLALVGSDDPLLAGLEIYAQPPGKKLSALSLLSGGEQALTALSLIFAMFRCNPAPVCVLDEVDAPLDDANTERFCSLLDDMVRETQTRFLVVTHHHLTMARMDRLYGVTMAERGVSRVLSVDLARATALTPGLAVAAE